MELYLNAFSLAKGVNPTTICGLRHDLGERVRMASDAGLVLRKRAMVHLATLSLLNRVIVTVDELSRTVRKVLRVSP
ncbi:hypothetical protein ACQZ6F_28935 [Rhizobium sp. A22-96]